MNRKTLIALLCGAAAVTAVALAVTDHKAGKTEKSRTEDEDFGFGSATQDYVTYEADFGDGYKMYFDYHPGLKELGTMGINGVVTDDFGMGTTMLTATHVPERYNIDPSLPHTAEEYIATEIDAEFSDALPYKEGKVSGYSYWERHEYSYGTGFTQGYNLFLDGEYFYIFAHRNDMWPDNIENVRIVKD